MTTLIFDWSDWDGPATGHVVVTRRTWRRAPESLHVPWQVVLPVDGRATLDVAHVAGESVSIRWAPQGAASRVDHVLVPDGGEHLAHLLERVDPSTLEPLPEDLPSAVDLVARAEAAVTAAKDSAGDAGSAAERADAAATLSQESARFVLPMVSGSVTIAPNGGALAVDLGQAVNVTTGLAETSGAVDVTFPPVTTPDGRVNPDGLGTLLRVDAGADRLTWPGGTVVHGTPPAGQPALASLVRVGGSVTVVWPPTVVTSPVAGVTAKVATLEQIIGGEVEVQSGGTVMASINPGTTETAASPAVFVNHYNAAASRGLSLSVGRVSQLVICPGGKFRATAAHRASGVTDWSIQTSITYDPAVGPPTRGDGWVIATPSPTPVPGVTLTSELSKIRSRVAKSGVYRLTGIGYCLVLKYDPGDPGWTASLWGSSGELNYRVQNDPTPWVSGAVSSSGLSLPIIGDEAYYATRGVALSGQFYRAAELKAMGLNW